MTRDRDRIANMVNLIYANWIRDPDSRLGQLVANAAAIAGWRELKDVFHCEDDVMADGLRRMLNGDETVRHRFSYLVIERPTVNHEPTDYQVVLVTDSLVEAERWVFQANGSGDMRRYIIVRDC